ncbi:glycosyltransferase family 2 protein [uncultured Thomasclavelia sp.]|uniref:glycosyltransferase family 2 protein n=1 Tax=uncultured Thomasclavelia sp. TaxID=3025759 RepID=UPI0025CDD56E|nr:glycosyltransferase family 2 protein [uncultured Thomasclavelia sp.]
MDKISIIVPCFNEEEVLPLFHHEVSQVLKEIENVDYELIFIDDGSRDRTKKLLELLCAKDQHCNYYSFSRNFGKEAAMLAGLEQATGNYCVIMDADLQHPPKLLPEMYQAVSREGYDCCAGKRIDREGEGKLRNFLSRSFYKVMQKMSNLDMSDGAGDFRMMSRLMVDSILKIREYNRYMKGIFSYVGFDTKWIPYHNVERAAGKTKWNFKSLFSYALEGMFSFSTAPLKIAGIFGVILFVGSIILLLYTAISTLLFGNSVSGYTTIVCLILFLSGSQMLFTSILGQYISKDYMENKARPIYIVKDSNRKQRYN